MSGDFYSMIEREPEEIPVATVTVPRTKHKESKDDASHSGDDFSCPYDLKYCDETIAAYKRFEDYVHKCLDTNSEILIPQQDGWTTDLPPCESETRAKCPRYQVWLKNNIQNKR